MSCSVYILRSDGDGTYYIGSAEHVKERVELHNSPRARWTKRHQPWRLIHTEEYGTRSEAVRRERHLKLLKGIEKYLDDVLSGKK